MKSKVEPFITIPRSILSDLRNGKLTYREYELYLLVRLHTNPFGISTVNIAGILADAPHFKSQDNITKLLRSLLRKRYVYYPARQGRRGTFEVRQDNWLSTKGVLTIEKYFSSSGVGSPTMSDGAHISDVSEGSYNETPNSNDESLLERLVQNVRSENNILRGSHNDTNMKIESDLQSSISYKKEGTTFRRRVETRNFDAKNDAERRCKNIAEQIDDKYINFTLSILYDKEYGGIEALEQAYDECADRANEYSSKEPIRNLAAMFNQIVTAIVDERKLKGLRNPLYGQG